jgi:hypothetical protein
MSLNTRCVSSEDEYWAEVQQLKGSSQFFEDEQGKSHGHIDGDLQDSIEGILVPLAGPWENSDVWFHNQDFYGDGIRSLTFRVGDFPWSAVVPLQKLLMGDAARFCVSVHIADSLETQGRWVGSIAIFQEYVVATTYAAEMLREHFGVET